MCKNAFQELMHEIALWLFISAFALSGSVTAQHKAHERSSSGNAFEQLCINGNTNAITPEKNNKTHPDYVQNCDACVLHTSFANTSSNPVYLIPTQFAQHYDRGQTLQHETGKAAILPPSRGPPIFI